MTIFCGLTWDKNGIFKRDIGYGWGYDGDVMEISWWYSEIQSIAINYVCLTPMMTVANWPLMVTYIRLSLRNIHFNGHSRNLNWRYLPYIRPFFKAYVPTKHCLIWYVYLPPSVGSGRSPIEHSHPVILHFHQPQKNAIEGPSTGATVALSHGAASII